MTQHDRTRTKVSVTGCPKCMKNHNNLCPSTNPFQYPASFSQASQDSSAEAGRADWHHASHLVPAYRNSDQESTRGTAPHDLSLKPTNDTHINHHEHVQASSAFLDH